MSLEPWKQKACTPVLETRVFTVLRQVATSPRTGLDHEFYWLDTPDWINVVPVTTDGQVVLVRQFRQGTADFTLEIPGGMVEPGDESPAMAARRELLEETGYAAENFRPVGWVFPNPAIQNNRCHTFVAEGAYPVADPTPDGGEDLAVELIGLGDVLRLVAEGRITHSLVIAAFALSFGLDDPDKLLPGPTSKRDPGRGP